MIAWPAPMAIAHHRAQRHPRLIEPLVQTLPFTGERPLEFKPVAGNEPPFPQVLRGQETRTVTKPAGVVRGSLCQT